MSTFSKILQLYRGSFLKMDPSSIPEIACVFIGGSQLYTQTRLEDPTDTRSDYNAIVVMGSKYDVCSIWNEGPTRRRFFNMMGIKLEESASPFDLVPGSPLYADIDGIVVAGYDGTDISTSTKRTIKVLSLEYFAEGKSSLNLLSYQDMRVLDGISLGNELSMKTLQQVTTLDQCVVLHDQWFYSTPGNGDANTLTAFGATIDLLLSGARVYGINSYGKEIKEMLIRYYITRTGHSPSVKSFAKYPKFQPFYVEWLSLELADLSDTSPAGAFDPSLEGVGDHVILPGDTVKGRVSASLSNPLYTRNLPQEIVAQFDEGRVTKQESNETVFSHNSTSYRATTLPPNAAEIFVKVTAHAEDELQGAKMALQYFPRITVPSLARSGELLYPYFAGATQSDARLAFIKSGRKDVSLLNSILHIEMVKAQDTLCAYTRSLSLTPNAPENGHKIQRFYHDRLIDDTRMRRFYGQGISLAGETFSLDELLSLKWIINNEEYASLREAFDEARGMIAPGSAPMVSCPTVFGLGDAHSSNIMFLKTDSDGYTNDVRWIDYEVAGFHPVMLDLGKPIYNTVFFETLDQRLMQGQVDLGLRFSVDREANTITVNLSPRVDALAQAILDIQLRYLIKPLHDEVGKQGGNLEDHVPLLGTVLFLCATVARNFANNEQAFVSNFATGLILRKARAWSQFASALAELGFDC